VGRNFYENHNAKGVIFEITKVESLNICKKYFSTDFYIWSKIRPMDTSYTAAGGSWFIETQLNILNNFKGVKISKRREAFCENKT
jgi:hypothetical protein